MICNKERIVWHIAFKQSKCSNADVDVKHETHKETDTYHTVTSVLNNIPCTANLRWRRANPVCFILRKRTPALATFKVFCVSFSVIKIPEPKPMDESSNRSLLFPFNQSHLSLQLHFPNNQCWKILKYAIFCDCMGVKCRSIEYRPHWKWEQIPCSVCRSCYKQLYY